MPKIWVFGEIHNRRLDPTALELLTRARELGEAEAVILGPGATDAAGQLGDYGATTVYAADDPVYDEYVAQPAAHALHRLVTEHTPHAVLFATLFDSRDVAGRLAARLGATLVSNVIDLPSLDVARTAIFGGSLYVDCKLQGRPVLILVRPNSFAAEPCEGSARLVSVDVGIPEDLRRARRIQRHEEPTRGPKLTAAPVVVAGGAGLGGPQNFELLYELASAIGGAAVGATRAAVEARWVPQALQIGLTGATVKPSVYLAFGISGASQHVVGMKRSKSIIAVNTDENAPILRIADMGVVGDAVKILPKLIEEVRARKD